MFDFFFFNDTATTEIYTLSLHDALPISFEAQEDDHAQGNRGGDLDDGADSGEERGERRQEGARASRRSEEHTSELQSRQYLVCRLLLEKKKQIHERYTLISPACHDVCIH